MFCLTDNPILTAPLADSLRDPRAGAFVTFEGWVREQNHGRPVAAIEYDAYAALAESEGTRILDEARQRFDLVAAGCVHRIGRLTVGDLAVWAGVSAAHREAAFDACRFIIDQVKSRTPIWKKEHYVDGDAGWINCECGGEAGPDTLAP